MNRLPARVPLRADVGSHKTLLAAGLAILALVAVGTSEFSKTNKQHAAERPAGLRLDQPVGPSNTQVGSARARSRDVRQTFVPRRLPFSADARRDQAPLVPSTPTAPSADLTSVNTGVPRLAPAEAASQDSQRGADRTHSGSYSFAYKLDSTLREAVATGRTEPHHVIVQARGAQVLAQAAVTRIGGHVYAAHRGIGAVAATVSGSDLQKLAELPEVAHVSLDAAISAQGDVPDSELTSGQILYKTLGLKEGGGIDSGGSSFAGDKITVAVVDSGIETSKDIVAGRVKAFYDFTRRGIAVKPSDSSGHGTHVAGLIGGSGDLSSDKQEGIASKVSFVGYKVLDETGAGYTSEVIAAIEHATAHRRQLGIDVMNLSLGHPIFEPAGSDPLVQAVERAVAAGIVVVVSSGNAGKNLQTGEIGYAGITSPGNAPSAITYDAYLKPDIVAPGRRVVAVGAANSALYSQHPDFRVDAYSGQLNSNGEFCG